MRISEVVAAKASQEVVTITPGATVRDLVVLLTERNIGAVIVSTDGATVAGIVSERDVVRRLLGEQGLLAGPVSAIMTADVHSVAPTDSLDDVRRLMTERRFRHAPVVDHGRLVGIVSIGDVVKAHTDQLQFERDQLDSYVHQAG
ncbi:MAG: CBS domain-containing protein [Marmoricola sp.]